ncbi:MAG: putative signal transduction histidine kinase, partial [Brevundimonas sp.]|nr:putative signal transduction histidine kinase [Brevundimonas sp.]
GIRLRTVIDPESRRHLTWLSDVTAAMSLLNRRTTEAGPIDFSAYLQDATEFWRRAAEVRAIRIDVRAGSVAIPESHALPMAIIVHELVSNAVRHAFPDEMRGSVAIACSQSTEGVSLVVRDSGVGLVEMVHGDGLALVSGLVEHLNGFMSVETAPGAGVGVRIRLPLDADQRH